MGSLYDRGVKRVSTSDEEFEGGSLYQSGLQNAKEEREKTGTTTATKQAEEPTQQGFLGKTASNVIDLLKPGGVTPVDVAKEIPGVAKEIPGTVARGGIKAADVFFPAIKNAAEVTGGVIGEGLAFAIDPNVREQVRAGNKAEVLPILNETSPADYAKDVFAAGLEYGLLRYLPSGLKNAKGVTRGKASRAGIGMLEGAGFGVAEGLADDKTPEKIIEGLPTYAALGGGVNVFAPYLLPALKSSFVDMPKNVNRMFRGIKDEVQPGAGRRVNVKSSNPGSVDTPVQVFTPGQAYRNHMADEGFDPIVPDDELPVIDWGDGLPPSRVAGELPTVSPDSPSNVIAPRTPIVERISALSDAQKDEVLRSTRRLATASSRGPGLPWNTAQETALARFEARLGEAEGTLRIVPEERVAADVTPEQQLTQSQRQARVEQEVSQQQTLQQRADFETQRATQAAETRTTRVPQEQLPVGEGAERVSRLEARMRGVLDSPRTAQRAQEEGIETYTQMSKQDQMTRAAQLVDENPEQALAIVRGDQAPPEGLLNNSVALALEQRAASAADANLATKLASLRSTRAGQEISILTEADPSNPITQINEIITARKTRAAKRIKGAKTVQDVDKEITRVSREAKEQVSARRLKLDQAEALLDRITC